MDKLEQFTTEKDLAESTAGLYRSAVKAYEKCCSMPLGELIEEADIEEENSIRWKKRKVKEHLMTFRKANLKVQQKDI